MLGGPEEPSAGTLPGDSNAHAMAAVSQLPRELTLNGSSITNKSRLQGESYYGQPAPLIQPPKRSA